MSLGLDTIMAQVTETSALEKPVQEGKNVEPEMPLETVSDAVLQNQKLIDENKAKREAEEATKLAEEQAKKNAEETVKEEEPEVDPNPGVNYRRPIPRSDSKAQTAGRKPNKNSDTCEIRAFPKSLMMMIKQSLNGGNMVPNTKALAAFVYANRDTSIEMRYDDVPDDVIELSKTFDKNRVMNNMDKNMTQMMKRLMKLDATIDDVALAVAYLIFDRGGFNTQNPGRPSDINFKDKGIMETMTNLEKTNDDIKMEQKIQNGTPIK